MATIKWDTVPVPGEAGHNAMVSIAETQATGETAMMQSVENPVLASERAWDFSGSSADLFAEPTANPFEGALSAAMTSETTRPTGRKAQAAIMIGKLASIGLKSQDRVVASNSEAATQTDDWGFEAPAPGTQLRRESGDDIDYYTNLPQGIFPFEKTQPGEEPKHPSSRNFLPNALDSVPAGEFFIARPTNLNPQVADERFDRKLVITDAPDGKRINRIFDGGLIKNIGKTEALMTALGNEFEVSVLDEGLESEEVRYGDLLAVPTPETASRKAAELGVNIKYFPDQSIIAGKDYLQTFKDEQYPVSTQSAEYFEHDTRDDHLTAMVLGAEPLKAGLSESAKLALEQGTTEKEWNDWAAGIDDFTAYLRGTVSPTYNTHNELIPYGFDTLLSSGKPIGLDAAVVTKIYDTARENAAKWGMVLNPEPVSLRKAN